MPARILDIPDDAAGLPEWLERELVGLHLGMLTRELCLVRESPEEISAVEAVESWLGDDRQPVLAAGLQALPAPKLHQLLEQPQLLPALQELVLVEGGAYWQNLLQRAAPAVPPAPAVPLSSDTALSDPVPAVERSALSAPGFAWRWWSLAVAAVLLVGVSILVARRQPAGPTWGWNQPDLFAQDQAAPEYLSTLAEAGQAWFQQRPDSNAALAQRIREMRQGCDRLIAHSHPPLAEVDRDWLRERCLAWRDKLDAQLTALEQGAEVSAVRSEVDAVVDKLVMALKQRSDELRS